MSYGADPYRDGVTLTPKRELQALALPSEIMRLPNLRGYLKLPGPFPVARFRLKYVKRPKVAPGFVERERPRGDAGRADAKAAADAGAPLPAERPSDRRGSADQLEKGNGRTGDPELPFGPGEATDGDDEAAVSAPAENPERTQVPLPSSAAENGDGRDGSGAAGAEQGAGRAAPRNWA